MLPTLGGFLAQGWSPRQYANLVRLQAWYRLRLGDDLGACRLHFTRWRIQRQSRDRVWARVVAAMTEAA